MERVMLRHRIVVCFKAETETLIVSAFSDRDLDEMATAFIQAFHGPIPVEILSKETIGRVVSTTD